MAHAPLNYQVWSGDRLLSFGPVKEDLVRRAWIFTTLNRHVEVRHRTTGKVYWRYQDGQVFREVNGELRLEATPTRPTELAREVS